MGAYYELSEGHYPNKTFLVFKVFSRRFKVILDLFHLTSLPFCIQLYCPLNQKLFYSSSRFRAFTDSLMLERQLTYRAYISHMTMCTLPISCLNIFDV